MINTDYNALNVYASDTRSRASQTSDMTLVSEENARGAKNARSTNDVAAVLTLSARAAAKTPILKRGSRGTAVEKLQKNLTKLGYDTKGTDGIFGKDTENAVKRFQKAHKLTADGIVGEKTRKAINKALEGIKNPPAPKPPAKGIQKILDNIKNDKSLGLSKEKKAALTMAAERLLKDNYEVAFVAGVLGNIMNEGTPGKFESSNYKSNPAAEPGYLKYMDKHFNYRNKFSGRSICDVGIKATEALQKKVKASGYAGKFGLGMIQWTGERTERLIASYKKYSKGDKPTINECIKAEVNFMADELKGAYSNVYKKWKAGNKTAKSAGDIVCRMYEVPRDTNGEAKRRAENASKLYKIMTKK